MTNAAQTHHARALGDLRAEADARMLDVAFLETPDYLTLIESADRVIVVGRRGSGKSALAYQLEKHWNKQPNSRVVQLDQEEDQVLSLRPLLQRFGSGFRMIKAAARRIWDYAILMEVSNALSDHFKFGKYDSAAKLYEHLRKWRALPSGVSAKVFYKTRQLLNDPNNKLNAIGDIPILLELREIRQALQDALSATSLDCILLIDRLDEGYEPDEVGVGLIDGLVQAVIDLRTDFPQIRPTVFLRDNIFRAVAKFDPDYSRNIEGQVLRLHWDEYQLLGLVANRLRTAFHVSAENNQKVWDRCTARELQTSDGFKRCLRLTLYRPRDVVSLLNDAFLTAFRHGRSAIVPEDVDAAGKSISENRLDDLRKEYSIILPGIHELTSSVANRPPRYTHADLSSLLDRVLAETHSSLTVEQSFAILGNGSEAIRALYGVGFLGIEDTTTHRFVFCHDGRAPQEALSTDARLLVHPCYWSALNLADTLTMAEQSEEIYDEYDIEVSSLAREYRHKKLGQLIAELDSIEPGETMHAKYEEWCLRALRVVFAGALRNFELHPNKQATQRRDIVATNLGEKSSWRRVLEDYGTRQVLFEAKNYRDLTFDDYRQVLSYLSKEYGKIGFIICRGESEDLRKGTDLNWLIELHSQHNVIVVKLTSKFISRMLSKLRSPSKHDAPDATMNGLLDKYQRLYLRGQV